MGIQSALITDQDITFLVIAVPKPVLEDRDKAEHTVRFFEQRGQGLPVALVTRDAHGAPSAYYGRGDLAIRLLRRRSTTMLWNDHTLS